MFHHQAFSQHVESEIAKFPADVQDDIVILFSAHSLPMSVSISHELFKSAGSIETLYLITGIVSAES